MQDLEFNKYLARTRICEKEFKNKTSGRKIRDFWNREMKMESAIQKWEFAIENKYPG